LQPFELVAPIINDQQSRGHVSCILHRDGAGTLHELARVRAATDRDRRGAR
jgi:hypothetical protein